MSNSEVYQQKGVVDDRKLENHMVISMQARQ